MAKIQTLTLNKEFKRAYYRGRSFATPVLVVYALKNRSGENRLGLTATKKWERLLSATERAGLCARRFI